MEFTFNNRGIVTIEPSDKLLIKEGDTFTNEKITYTANETGFYQFTGFWFWFLFPYKGLTHEEYK